MRILTQLYLTPSCVTSFFFFNDPAPTEIYPLSLHDALPIPSAWPIGVSWTASNCHPDPAVAAGAVDSAPRTVRSRAILDRKSTRLNSSHQIISYAVFCLKKKKYNSRTDVRRSQLYSAEDIHE